MKALYAGVWVGEFGHEIMIWQAYLRAIAPNYDYIVVCGPKGHFGMYSDFADRYITFECDTTYANMWMNDAVEKRANKFFKDMYGVSESARNADWITPRMVWEQYVGIDKSKLIIAIEPREFIKFGGEAEGYDILYHARYRTDWDSGFRNWPEKECLELLVEFPGLKIGCVGLRDSALYFRGTDDLRDIPLSDLTAIMSNSKVFIGPISGPTHLATLCGLPQVTWATKKEHAQRVKTKWNPLDTDVKVITANDSVWRKRTPWTPTTEELKQNVRSFLDVETQVPV